MQSSGKERFGIISTQATPEQTPTVGIAGSTRDATEGHIRKAIEMSLEGLAEDGLPLSEADSVDMGKVELGRPA